MKIEFTPQSDIDDVRIQLVAALSTSVCRVDFTKIDGEHRLMTCTLRTDLLPTLTESVKQPKIGSTLSVWDVEKSGWRSFRLNQVNAIEIL